MYSLTLSKLPSGLITIGSMAFYNCYPLMITEIGTANNAPNLIQIGSQAFAGAGDNVNGPIYIGRDLGVGESYLTIQGTAFSKYGANDGANI